MADPCLQISIETAGVLSAFWLPVLLLGVSLTFAYGALGETGLLLVFRRLQSVGVFRGSLAMIVLLAIGRMAAEWVKFTGVDGVAAGALAVAAGATVSAIISAIVAALTARSIRARLDTSIENFITLMIRTAAGGLLFQMGMSLLFGQRNRGGTNRGMDEDEDTDVNSEEEFERERKRRWCKKRRTAKMTY